MATRIRVRRGDTEVEYEGSEQFLKTELASLLQAASMLPAGSRGPSAPAAGGAASRGKAPARETSGGKRSARTSAGRTSARRSSATGTSGRQADRKASTAAGSAGRADDRGAAGANAKTPVASPAAVVAAKIGCKHGTDLVLAASAQLNLGAGQRSFSRAELLGEMKTAGEYYKPVYGKNLSRYLRNLLKERQLNEPRPGIYALTAPARREMGKILAD